MNNAEARARLQEKASTLSQRIDAISRDLQQAHSASFAEQASERENDDVLHGLLAESRRSLQQVNDTLARIDEGSYGLCIRCGNGIDEQRLAALPEAETCIHCMAVAGY